MRKIEQPEPGDGREKIGHEDWSGVARSEISHCHDIGDVDDAGAHQESGPGERSRKPRLEALEGGIERSKSNPEIGDAHLELERTIGPADKRRRLRREEDVTDKGPQAEKHEGND